MAGLTAVVAPLVLSQAPAGAAQTSVTVSESLTFVRVGTGTAVTCDMGFSAFHNTDDARHPYVDVVETAGWTGDHEPECVDDVTFTATVSYKDTGGNTQTSVVERFTHFRIGGAKSDVHVVLSAHYFDCNESASATCDVTASASPK